MKKRNCVYFTEEYIGNPGVTPTCGKKSKFDFDCTWCKDFVSREDKVIVVRCKDCRYWGVEIGFKETDTPKLNPQPDGTVYAECVHGPVEIGDSMYTDGEFYCAFGERREVNG